MAIANKCNFACLFFLLLYREAEDGFNKCKLCGFENFKRFPFCNVCGQAIALGDHAEDATQLKALYKKKKHKSSAVDVITSEQTHDPRIAATQRQQRARYAHLLVCLLCCLFVVVLLTLLFCVAVPHSTTQQKATRVASQA